MDNDVLNEKFIDELNCLIDLHLHLDGALSVDSIKKLAKIQDIELNMTDEEILKKIQVSKRCKDLNEFLEKFVFPLQFLQTKEGIKNAVKNLLEELKLQGYMYVEIRFAPQLLLNKGLTQEEVVKASIEGLYEVDLSANLILCCMRGDDNKNKNIVTVDVAKKFLNKGVVAIDLAGGEGLYKTKNFEEIFKYAKDNDVPFVIHAGEADGIESIKDAIEFGAKRIGHGVRACDDIDFINELSKMEIPLEICYTSNEMTKVNERYNITPIRVLIDNKVKVTINTDDPSIEGISLKDDYKKLMNNADITKEELKEALLNSVKYSFATKEMKEDFINKINNNFKKISNE